MAKYAAIGKKAAGKSQLPELIQAIRWRETCLEYHGKRMMRLTRVNRGVIERIWAISVIWTRSAAVFVHRPVAWLTSKPSPPIEGDSLPAVVCSQQRAFSGSYQKRKTTKYTCPVGFRQPSRSAVALTKFSQADLQETPASKQHTSRKFSFAESCWYC